MTHVSPAAKALDVLYSEHEVGGQMFFLRGGKMVFYVLVRPLHNGMEVTHTRTLEQQGHFGHAAILLNILHRCEDWRCL